MIRRITSGSLATGRAAELELMVGINPISHRQGYRWRLVMVFGRNGGVLLSPRSWRKK